MKRNPLSGTILSTLVFVFAFASRIKGQRYNFKLREEVKKATQLQRPRSVHLV